MDQLTRSLLDLLGELEGREIALTVGGGFGLYLKWRHLEAARERTLLDRLPEPRATNDLDLFLRAEVLADLGRTREVAEAIRRLGYVPVAGAEFLQWKRAVLVAGVVQEVKIDILVGPLGQWRKQLHVKKPPRVRPKGSIAFHAHAVEEALAIEDDPITLTVHGRRSTGEPHRGTVLVPAAFPYLMMKPHAFDDRQEHLRPREHYPDAGGRPETGSLAMDAMATGAFSGRQTRRRLPRQGAPVLYFLSTSRNCSNV